MGIKEKDAIRNRLLLETYNLTDGNPSKYFDFSELGAELNIPYEDTENAYNYLKSEGFIEPYGMGYTIKISHYGVKFVESILRRIDFDENKNFNSTEIYQLKITLEEIKEELAKLQLGQEIVFDRIDEAFEESKLKTKQEWKEYFKHKMTDWTAEKIINFSSQVVISGLLWLEKPH